MRFVLLFSASLAGLGACTSAPSEGSDGWNDWGDEVGIDPYEEPPPEFVPNSEIDAGAIAVPERPRGDAGAPPPRADAGPTDASAPGACAPLGPGSLLVVELLIKSIDGAGDRAEWVELKNPADCVLSVPAGLRVLSPRGTGADEIATVETAFELPPFAAFLAGGPDAPSHPSLPTLRWAAADTLKNTGDTVRIEIGEAAAPVIVDSLVYPSFSNLYRARSVAFPSDCPDAARASFSNWSGSFADYPPGPLVGTPFASNDDVTCAPPP